jgi:hypothetical protein
MDKFVARENVRHFRDRLETETDATARSVLQSLLIEEEDKLGHDCEALREIEGHIAQAKGHVQRQQVLVSSMQREGNDATPALALLNAYSQVLLAFESQHNKILTRRQHSAFY